MIVDIVNFKDIFKGSFLKSGFLQSINITDMVMGLFLTFVLAMFIFYIYKKTYSGVVYNYSYNVSLVLMSLITSMVIMTISSNLVISLGMVGALSIVRFRTAVKEPLDIVFMFWAIALGLTTGAKLYIVAIFGSLFIGIVTIVLMRFKNTNNIYLLIVHYEKHVKEKLYYKLNELDYTIKSKTANKDIIELTLELRLIGANTDFVEELSEMTGVINTSLVSYNGNFIE